MSYSNLVKYKHTIMFQYYGGVKRHQFDSFIVLVYRAQTNGNQMVVCDKHT